MKILKSNNKYNVEICTTFLSRFKGLMFKKNIDRILCFPKCNSIHTFFCLRKIDVVMTDKNFKIVKIYKSLKPWKVILPQKNVYYTFEFKENLFDFKLNQKLGIIKNE